MHTEHCKPSLIWDLLKLNILPLFSRCKGNGPEESSFESDVIIVSNEICILFVLFLVSFCFGYVSQGHNILCSWYWQDLKPSFWLEEFLMWMQSCCYTTQHICCVMWRVCHMSTKGLVLFLLVSYTYCTTHPHTSTYQVTANSLYLPTSNYLHPLPTYQWFFTHLNMKFT